MVRLHFVVEGQTEEEFVNSVLASHLGAFNVGCDARCVETSRTRYRIHRGGLRKYAMARKDLSLWMKQDNRRDAWFTTMFDLYRLPRDFPGFETPERIADPYARLARLEEAFRMDIDHPRFIPYLQLHEFEALLLSEPSAFEAEFIDQNRAIQELAEMCASHTSPELIDEDPETSPSRRINQKIPQYEGRKASAGPRIAAKIGLPTLRQKCRHFNEWLMRLESLPAG